MQKLAGTIDVNSMLDMNADPTSFSAAFGMHVDMIEMGDLKKRVNDATPAEVSAMRAQIEKFFTFPEPGSDRRIAGKVSPEALSLMVPEIMKFFFDCASNTAGDNNNKRIMICLNGDILNCF